MSEPYEEARALGEELDKLEAKLATAEAQVAELTRERDAAQRGVASEAERAMLRVLSVVGGSEGGWCPICKGGDGNHLPGDWAEGSCPIGDILSCAEGQDPETSTPQEPNRRCRWCHGWGDIAPAGTFSKEPCQYCAGTGWVGVSSQEPTRCNPGNECEICSSIPQEPHDENCWIACPHTEPPPTPQEGDE